MALQPQEQDIGTLMALFPDMVRAEALARLKGNNNNVEQAVNEFYDSPDSSQKYRYDESLFNMDRDGANNTPGVSFQVHAPDELAPTSSGRFDGAMSRPPSRANNKSPLSSVVDLTSEHTNGVNPKSTLYYGDDGDRELQEAIAASRADAGLPPQASGTTSTAQVHFGPANRNQYEPGQWDMVPLGVSSREILLDPEPAERKRDINIPAFLKPSVGDHRLGALITMYHEIPAVREVFLDRKRVLEQYQYGHHPEWWNGHKIEVIDLLGEVEDLEDEVPVELQRLMAFLDKTDRSYGSVDSLANMKDVKKARKRTTFLESAVMAAWKSSSGTNPAGIKKIFSRGVQSDSEENAEGEEFAILELTYPGLETHQETLYDIADEVLWPINTDVMESAYLSHMAEVIVFKLGADAVSYKKVDIPAVWYPDRYMKQNRQAAWEMRMAQWEVSKELERISNVEEKLTNFPTRNGKILKVRDLFAASLRHDEAQLKEVPTPDSDDMDGVQFQGSSKTANLSAQLQKLANSIDRKLKELSEQREKAIATMHELSQLYTKQSDEPDAPTLTKYLLRGVSTTKDVTYICRRAVPDLIEMDLGDDEPSRESPDQWWKIAYVSDGYNARTVVEKTTEEAVLEAAKNESNNVLLVYASEKAMQTDVHPIPQALDYFVQWDNATFKKEFPVGPVELSSSQSPASKRKFDDSDASSPTREADRDFRNTSEPARGWDNSAQAAARHLNARVNVTQEDDMVIGIDPALLAKDQDHESDGKGVEMQERVNAPLLGQMRRDESDNTSLETIDHMDMVVEEDSQTAEESAAVKHVEFGRKGST